MKKTFSVLTSIVLLAANASVVLAQVHDKGKFIEYKNPFLKKINEGIAKFEAKKHAPKLSFKMDFTGRDLPTSVDQFTKYWHNAPISQGNSGMCWCFSTTSMLESDCYRLHKKQIKISELYTVYWEYVEKARRFVRRHGDSYFAQGSQGNAVLRIWKKYGCVPAAAYTGMKPGQTFHAHTKLFNEMNTYLRSVKQEQAWNEPGVLATIQSILDYHLGRPPVKFTYQGKEMTPKRFLAEEVQLNPDDYVDILSLMASPYWKKAEYKCPDNWWHSRRYDNVPLADFMTAIKQAVKSGYTLFIGGDTSESGYFAPQDVAMVPTYDIPSAYIDDSARQFRFSNRSTTDDHGIHIVGYQDRKDGTWFLIKDSGSGSRAGPNKGYYFYHEDYVKLKMMNFIVHKSAVAGLLKKMQPE